jgi:hypothetical protein
MSVLDLISIDPEVGKIAMTESIRLDGSEGMIRRGLSETALELSSVLQSFGNLFSPASGEIPYGHMTAVRNTGVAQLYSQQRAHFSQIVVSGIYNGESSPLKQYVAYAVLAYFYRAAVERKTVDRYQVKLDRLQRDIEFKYLPFLMNTGMPVVNQPLACPGAKLEPGAGVWSAANISSVSGGTDAAADYDVAVSYTGRSYVSQSDRKNAESALSEIIRFSLPINSRLAVSIASLTPPTATQPTSSNQLGGYTRLAATGWNIWVGTAGGTLYLQQANPIATASFTFDAAPVLSGPVSHDGQDPDGRMIIGRALFRG